MGGPSPKKSKRQVKDLIAGAKLPERSVDICLRADLQDEWAGLQRALLDRQDRLRETGAGSLGTDPEARELAEQQEALRQEMLDASVTFTLRGLPRGGGGRKARDGRPTWMELYSQYPPREGNERDKALGANEEEFAEALVRACVVEPQLDDDDWQDLLENALTDATYSTLVNTAWAVNKRDTSVPFSRAASMILSSSDSG